MDLSSLKTRLALFALAVLLVGAGLLWWQWYPLQVRRVLGGEGTDQDRAEALRALGSDALPAMGSVYASPDLEFDRRVLLGRVIMREPFRRIGVIEKALSDSNVAVRRVSAYLLVNGGADDDRVRIVEVLERWTDDPAWEHRGELVGTLAHLANPLRRRPEVRCQRLLAKLLGRGEEEGLGVRVQAARVLGTAEGPEITEALVRAVRTDPADKVRASALRALAAQGWDEDLELYDRVADSEDPSARLLVANALGGLRRRGVVPILVKLLEDRDHAVRKAALDGLSALRSRVPGERAAILMEDSSAAVRRALVLAVQMLRIEEAIPVLIAGMRDREPDDYFETMRLIVPALYKLTGKHHGFDEAYFTRTDRDLDYEIAFMHAWCAQPVEKREEALAQWTGEYGEHDRRPALLTQLRHADPANVARAVRELHALSPDAPTPGFTIAKVKAALTNLDPRHAPFLDLEDEARMFQAMPEDRRAAMLAEWDRIH